MELCIILYQACVYSYAQPKSDMSFSRLECKFPSKFHGCILSCIPISMRETRQLKPNRM